MMVYGNMGESPALIGPCIASGMVDILRRTAQWSRESRDRRVANAWHDALADAQGDAEGMAEVAAAAIRAVAAREVELAAKDAEIAKLKRALRQRGDLLRARAGLNESDGAVRDAGPRSSGPRFTRDRTWPRPYLRSSGGERSSPTAWRTGMKKAPVTAGAFFVSRKDSSLVPDEISRLDRDDDPLLDGEQGIRPCLQSTAPFAARPCSAILRMSVKASA